MVNESEQKVLFGLSRLVSIITLGVAGYSCMNQSVYHAIVPEKFISGALSQDLVSILAALGLLFCISLIRRGRKVTWLVWVGLLGYLFYAYALYSFDRVYNLLFLFYVAIVGLSLYALIGFFQCADFSTLHCRPGHNHPPRKLVAVLFLFLFTVFVVLWLSMVIPAMRDRTPPDGNSIFVLDLSFFLPLVAIEARLLLKKAPLGDVLVIPLLIKLGTLGLSVMIGTLLAPWFGRDLNLAEVGLYSLMGLGPLALVVPFLSASIVGSTLHHET